MPTTLILDSDHVVRWIDVHPDYSTRCEPADILAALTHPVSGTTVPTTPSRKECPP